MTATLVFWQSHQDMKWFRKLRSPGHVSLVLDYKSRERGRPPHKLVTITWFADNANTPASRGATSSGGAGAYSGQGVTALSGNPQSSGQSAGHINAPTNMLKRDVGGEVAEYALSGAQEIQQLYDKMYEAQYVVDAPRFTLADQQRLTVLQQRYPSLAHWQQNRQPDESVWLNKILLNHASTHSVQAHNDVLTTRIRLPDQEAAIPTLSDPSVYIGLNDAAMVLWWK